MNNEFLLKVVNYVADHFGNLPDNSKPGFENFTNDEFDTAVKYLAEIGVLKLNQSKDFSYCGDYSGTLRATCPDFESHHSGEWEPYIPVIQSHLIGLYYIYFLYTVNTHLWCEYR